jgi:hypothetical protein
VAQHKRTLLVTDVANTFHHLDLAIEEASGWVMDPVAFDTRISALVELDSLRTALPAR